MAYRYNQNNHRENVSEKEIRKDSPKARESVDSLIDDDQSVQSNNFILQNQNFKLKSQINSLMIENNKFQIQVRELKHKSMVIQKLLSQKNDKNQGNANTKSNDNIRQNPKYNELKKKYDQLLSENSSLKKEIHDIFEKNRITPNFSNEDYLHQGDVLVDLVQKQQRITQLQNQLKAKQRQTLSFKNGINESSAQKIKQLQDVIQQIQSQNSTLLILQNKKQEQSQYQSKQIQKQKTKLKQNMENFQNKRKQYEKAFKKQSTQHYNKILSKQKIIQDLKIENMRLTLQIQQAKRNTNNNINNTTDNKYNSQIKSLNLRLLQKQQKNNQYEQKINYYKMQINKVKNEKNKMQYQLKIFMEDKNQLSDIRKKYQQKINQLQHKMSIINGQLLNEKNINRKSDYHQKKSNQLQRIQMQEVMEHKMKQNGKLKSQIKDLQQQITKLKMATSKNKESQTWLYQNNQLKKHLADISNEIINLTQENNDLKKKIQTKNLQLIENNQKIASQQEMSRSHQNTSKLRNQNEQLKANLVYKQQLIQILKIQISQKNEKEKKIQNTIKEKQQKSNQLQKVIQNLQEQIKKQKQCNRDLQYRVEELNEKLQCCTKINNNIQDLKKQLQNERKYFQQIKAQSERLKSYHDDLSRKKSQRSLESLYPHLSQQQRVSLKLNFQYNPFQQISPQNSQQELKIQDQRQSQHFMKSKGSQLTFNNAQMESQRSSLLKQKQRFSKNYYELQQRILQLENQKSKLNIDLSVKDELIIKLRQKITKPSEILFEPIIQQNKKNQFNHIFFENKIIQLQKNIKSMTIQKNKQIEQFKIIIRKQTQQKYKNELKKSHIYISQLQKKNNLLKDRLDEQKRFTQSMELSLSQINNLNYSIKYEFSENLEELNKLLQQYGKLQTKNKQLQNNLQMSRSYIEDLKEKKVSESERYFMKIIEEKQYNLSNASEQIKRLNQILMKKEFQLKNAMRKSFDSSSSFLRQQKLKQQSSMLKLPEFRIGQEMPSSDRSVQDEQLKKFLRKSPHFSRI